MINISSSSSSIFEQNINCDGNIRRRSLAPDLIQKVVSFIGEYKSNAIDAQQILTLEFISGVLEGTKKEILLTWFPKYRCALIAKLNQGCFQEPMRNLTLLGLSNHELRVQHKWGHGTEQTVQPTNFNVCTIEPVAAKDFSKFMKVFEETFSFIYEQDRRQKLGRHKKMSPAFIQLVLEETHRRFLREEDDIGRPLKGRVYHNVISITKIALKSTSMFFSHNQRQIMQGSTTKTVAKKLESLFFFGHSCYGTFSFLTF